MTSRIYAAAVAAHYALAAVVPSTTQTNHAPATLPSLAPDAQIQINFPFEVFPPLAAPRSRSRGGSSRSTAAATVPTTESSMTETPDLVTVNVHHLEEALIDRNFARRYVMQTQHNDWIFRLGARGPNATAEPNASSISQALSTNQQASSQRVHLQRPLIGWARLREGTVPALPQDILHRIQQRTTIAFDIYHVFPPFLLSDILYDFVFEPKASMNSVDAITILNRHIFATVSHLDSATDLVRVRRPSQQLLDILNDPRQNGAGASTDLAETRDTAFDNNLISRPFRSGTTRAELQATLQFLDSTSHQFLNTTERLRILFNDLYGRGSVQAKPIPHPDWAALAAWFNIRRSDRWASSFRWHDDKPPSRPFGDTIAEMAIMRFRDAQKMLSVKQVAEEIQVAQSQSSGEPRGNDWEFLLQTTRISLYPQALMAQRTPAPSVGEQRL